jgi:hypothetical protein
MVAAIRKRMLNGEFDVDVAAATKVGHLGCQEITHHIEWSDSVAAGTVEIEAAPRAGYTGTWAPVSTVVYSPPDAGGAKTDYVRTAGTYGAMRHRISGIVENGTVSTKIEGAA